MVRAMLKVRGRLHINSGLHQTDTLALTAVEKSVSLSNVVRWGHATTFSNYLMELSRPTNKITW